MQAEPYSASSAQSTAPQQLSFLSINRVYLRSYLGGILRLVQCGINLLVIITASINLTWLYLPLGGGWVIFVAVVGLIATSVVFVVHLCNLQSRLPSWKTLAEFCFALTMTTLYLIAFIVAAVRASQLDASVALCALFTSIALIAYSIDSYFSGITWRKGTQESNARGQPSAVVVTNSTYAVAGPAQLPPASQGASTIDVGYTGKTFDANSAWERPAY